jgi:hypothetical protein
MGLCWFEICDDVVDAIGWVFSLVVKTGISSGYERIFFVWFFVFPVGWAMRFG